MHSNHGAQSIIWQSDTRLVPRIGKEGTVEIDVAYYNLCCLIEIKYRSLRQDYHPLTK